MELYALNKSVTDYSNMTITVTAKGTKLYRCANWSFAERTCLGYWVEHMNLTRNEEYNLSQASAYAETGLIAINTHKSIYLPDEIANISIGVLDDNGFVICDANVTLLITDPSSVTTNLTTMDGDITVSDICSAHNKTYVPDYSTNYTVGEVGTYSMNATAEINATLKPNITSSFEVRNNVSFDVIRSTATRIVLYENYSVNFTIKANENFTGNMTEVVEPGFNITSQNGLVVEKYEDYTLLKFNVSFVNGSTYNIGYEYDAPDVSPELFLLGPLRIGNFSEARVWQIASDANYYINAVSILEPSIAVSISQDETFAFQCFIDIAGNGGSDTNVILDYQYCVADAAYTCQGAYSSIPTSGSSDLVFTGTNPNNVGDLRGDYTDSSRTITGKEGGVEIILTALEQ